MFYPLHVICYHMQYLKFGNVNKHLNLNPYVSFSLFFYLLLSICFWKLINKPVILYQQEKKGFEPRSSYVVEGLRANTEYTFSLAAVSSKGIGAFTNEIFQRTAQASTSMSHQNFCTVLLWSTGMIHPFTCSFILVPHFVLCDLKWLI